MQQPVQYIGFGGGDLANYWPASYVAIPLNAGHLSTKGDLTPAFRYFNNTRALSYEVAVSGSGVEVSDTSEALTLTEYPETIGLSLTVSDTAENLTLNENAEAIAFNVVTQDAPDNLVLTEYAEVIQIGDTAKGGGKKKKRQAEYDRAINSALRLRRQREAIEQAVKEQRQHEQKKVKPKLRLKKKALEAPQSTIKKIAELDLEIDRQIAIEFQLKQIEFKRKENEALMILLLAS